MKFKKLNIADSPYLGVYATVSNEFGLFPDLISKKTEKEIEETLDVTILKRNLGEAVVNGAISKIYKNKIIVSRSCTKEDVKFLEKNGLDVLNLSSYLAVGNLVSVNDNGLLLSTEFSEDEVKDIGKFIGKKPKVFNIASISLVGSCIALNNKGLAVYPHVSSDEFEIIKKLFKAEGNIATVNYGDGLVGNGLLVNDKGLIMGEKTTGYEIIRLDDIFG